MSEAFIDTESYDIQTYFYLYNPTEYKGAGLPDYFYINYELNSIAMPTEQAAKLDYSPNHLVYKVKGFTYEYLERVDIEVTSLQHVDTEEWGISNQCTFHATATHSKLNGLSVELSFNSTIILDDYIIKSIIIPRESSFWADMEYITFANSKKTKLVFYNFNYPKSIKPDKILKAIFNYDLVKYEATVNKKEEPGGAWATNSESGFEISREKIRPNPNEKGEYDSMDLGVYIPGTHTYKASNFSKELEFETFVLGNRVEKKEFGYIDMSKYKDDFEYGCSILLGATTIEVPHPEINGSIKTFENFENVEFIEMHYEKDGITYVSKIISAPIDEPPADSPPSKLPWWKQLWEYMVQFGEMVLEAMEVYGTPELVKGIVGCALSLISLIVGIVVLVLLLPQLFKLLIWILKLPFNLVKF